MSTRYPADFYAATHVGTEGDLAFYIGQCRDAETILELGCGFGRVLDALATAYPRARLTGIDIDADLLALASARVPNSVELIREDMQAFDLERTFDRVLLPHSTGYCLPDQAAVNRCLAAAYRHLKPGGRLLLDAYCADGFHTEANPDDIDEDELIPIDTITARDHAWAVHEQSTWYRDDQRIVARYIYSCPGINPEIGVIDQRYWLTPQIHNALTAAGFESVQIYGGFSGEMLISDSTHWAATATRPFESNS